MTEQPYNKDYYERETEYGDDIEAWAKANGLTLEDALEAGVYSPDDGDEQCIYLPYARNPSNSEMKGT